MLKALSNVKASKLWGRTAFVMLASFTLLPAAHARTGDLDQQTPTAYLEVDGQFVTYDSEAIEQAATGMATAYALGGWAGKDRVFGIALRSSQTTMTFKHESNASIAETLQDFIMKYRWGYAHITLAIATSQITVVDSVSDAAATQFDLIGVGYGGGGGFQYPFNKTITFVADYMLISTSTVHDKENIQTSVGLPTRTELELSSRFGIAPPYFNMRFGFRQATRQLSFARADASGTLGEEVTTNEVLTGPFVSLSFGIEF